MLSCPMHVTKVYGGVEEWYDAPFILYIGAI